jgi:hypothetical protein
MALLSYDWYIGWTLAPGDILYDVTANAIGFRDRPWLRVHNNPYHREEFALSDPNHGGGFDNKTIIFPSVKSFLYDEYVGIALYHWYEYSKNTLIGLTDPEKYTLNIRFENWMRSEGVDWTYKMYDRDELLNAVHAYSLYFKLDPTPIPFPTGRLEGHSLHHVIVIPIKANLKGLINSRSSTGSEQSGMALNEFTSETRVSRSLMPCIELTSPYENSGPIGCIESAANDVLLAAVAGRTGMGEHCIIESQFLLTTQSPAVMFGIISRAYRRYTEYYTRHNCMVELISEHLSRKSEVLVLITDRDKWYLV